MNAVRMSDDITLAGHKHVNIIVNLLQNRYNFHRREELCSTLFKQIVGSVGQHKLAVLLPTGNDNERYKFRNRHMFSIPRVKTKRFRNSFIMHYADKQQL